MGPSSIGTNGMRPMSTAFIALDWGTSSLRAYLVDADGAIRDRRAGNQGILSVEGGAFEAVFEHCVAGWDPDLPVLGSGMITSRQGWMEVGYVAAPAGLPDLVRGMSRMRTASGRQLAFVPGVSVRGGNGIPDVIRGEETHILGALEGNGGLFVTRGTHCKWVAVESGRIVRFATFMTGEMFAVLRLHGILGRLMTGEPGVGQDFERGVRLGLSERTGGAGLLHSLFSVRTLGLLGDLPGEALASYLSGLLIGAEIAQALQMFAPDTRQGLTIIGAREQAMAYKSALDIAGIASRLGPDDAAVRGLAKIGRQAGGMA